ncbi:MAG: peptide chain release factor N(5)-glutamine methyltransferase [Chloroflexota bacterium]|nr:peptide chain release factor N(5)-glutamine methyltransferase [Chloroflexota bacterium]
MNIQEAWAYGRSHLTQASVTPDLDARLLLEHVLQVNHSFLIAHADEILTDAQAQHYRQLICRAKQKEPVPYLTGTAAFYGFDFQVSPAVLIPRPETEQLVEIALSWAKSKNRLHIVDVGTGSGCIAVSLSAHLPQAVVSAVDISAEALAVARKNAALHVPDRVHFYEGELLEPIRSHVDLIVANLPYIASHEWTLVDDGVKWYEPTVALEGGSDGLDLIGEMLQQSTSRLRSGGAVIMEIGWQQGQAVERLARLHFPHADVVLIADYAGHDRIVTICT